MRCAACAHQWIAAPDGSPDDTSGEDTGWSFEQQLEEAERLERNLAALGHPVRGGGPLPSVESAAPAAPAGGRRGLGAQFPALAAIAASLALIVGAAWQYRVAVVRAVPATAALYELAGLDVNVRGMEFANVVVEREYENGLPVLAVEGEIVNVSQRRVDVPRVRFGLRDASAQEIYHWTMAMASEALEPDEHARFATRLSAPPDEAHDVVVRFHDVGDRRAAYVD